MNKSAAIRDWLTTQGQPRTMAEIAEALGIDRTMVGWMVGRMYRDGILLRSGSRLTFAYTLGRIVPPTMTKEQARARKAERERIRQQNRNWNRRTKAQYLADIAAQKAVRDAAKRAEKEARAAARAAARVKPPKPEKAPKPRPVAAKRKPAPHQGIRIAPAALQIFEETPKRPEVESVDAWMRRTGRKPDRLEPGACAHPMKRIGWQPERRKAA